MKHLLLALTLIACGLVPAWAQSLPLSDAVEGQIAALEEQVIAWRRDFHEHPELSNREFRTAKKVAAHLTQLGMEVTTDVAHTGVVGLLKGGKPGPVVALRADMDALPVTERVDVPFASKQTALYNGEEVGVMHACGHDTHVAMMMGVAEVLAGMQEELKGIVKFIFQPAEEGAPAGEEGGAELMVKEGVLTNPDVDAAFALHIDALTEVGYINYNAGGTFASADDLYIKVKGEQSHGAFPWLGVDPIVTAAHIITSLQTIVSRQVPLTEQAAVVTIGSIHGGNRGNIIPEEVEMVGTIRSLDPEVRENIHMQVRRIATNVAESMGATVEVAIGEQMAYPVTYNNPVLTAEMAPVLAAVAGAERTYVRKPETGAEDFAYFAERVPGFYFMLGGRPSDVPLSETADHHTPDFYIDESSLILGVRAMTAVALAYMERHAGN